MPPYQRQPWDSWYKKQRWRNRSRLQLQAHPLCAMCESEGIVEPARVADHIIPHKGDENLFWFGELQSLCHQHHSGTKAIAEARGYDARVDGDGFPIDPLHPANTRRRGG